MSCQLSSWGLVITTFEVDGISFLEVSRVRRPAVLAPWLKAWWRLLESAVPATNFHKKRESLPPHQFFQEDRDKKSLFFHFRSFFPQKSSSLGGGRLLRSPFTALHHRLAQGRQDLPRPRRHRGQVGRHPGPRRGRWGDASAGGGGAAGEVPGGEGKGWWMWRGNSMSFEIWIDLN